MARSHETNSLERRVRRLAVRYGLVLMICPKPFGKVLQHGGYMLREEQTRKIVFGNAGYEYAADLDEVETYLIRLKTEG